MTARLIQIRILWPFPAEEITPLVEAATPLIVAESNYSGQLANLLREQTGRAADHLILKYNGRPMSGQEVHRALQAIARGTGEHRIVLRNPFE